MNRIARALLSVSDKTGLVEFASELSTRGVEILSTGGTAKALQAAGLKVTAVQDVTGFPEMLDGRVKTLHPVIHGGILARRDLPEHMQAISDHGIAPIDLVCINLYPFQQTVADPHVTLEDAVENIDIGGPAMVRSAAKNHDAVTVLVDPVDYTAVLAEMDEYDGATTLDTRRKLAAKAYAHTGAYDAMISRWLRDRFEGPGVFPEELPLGFVLAQQCRYGENPHQKAAFYREPLGTEPCVSTARQIWGRELSFNNFYDINAALETVKDLSGPMDLPSAVIVKHTNPCGAASAETLTEAFLLAREGDPVSAFGGILAVNRIVDAQTADEITGKNCFFEAIIAPSFEPDAVTLLKEKKRWGADLRLLEVGDLTGWRQTASGVDLKKVVGGVLVQQRDLLETTAADLNVVTERAPTPEEMDELLFAWRIVRHVKSNAIVFTRNRQVVGVGAGQMNRVQSVRLAAAQAGEKAAGAVMASDAFFPFPDGPEAAAEAGVTAIIQPGGSRKDQDTIDLCNARGIAMVTTGIRHFLH
jgi:phosphoribosylaminoimidazolecarboxamide formyltransferase/IMP cyclohydrolase